MYKILGDRVLIRVLPLEKIKSYSDLDLILPDTAKTPDIYKQPTAVIEELGEGRLSGISGKHHFPGFNVGDVVIVNIPPTAVIVEMNDDHEHAIISAQEVIAVITDKKEIERQLSRKEEETANAGKLIPFNPKHKA